MKHPLFIILVALILGGTLSRDAAASASPSDKGVKNNSENSVTDVAGYTADDCVACHTGDGESTFKISLETFNSTAHGKAVTCLGCHSGITGEEHMESEKIEPVNCTKCHADKTGEGGLFSKAVSFRVASHPKADFSGHFSMEKSCLGCHQGDGAHGETVPVNSERCYLCHAPGLEQGMWGNFHPDVRNRSFFTMLLYSALFLFFLVSFVKILHPIFTRHSGQKQVNDKITTGNNQP